VTPGFLPFYCLILLAGYVLALLVAREIRRQDVQFLADLVGMIRKRVDLSSIPDRTFEPCAALRPARKQDGIYRIGDGPVVVASIAYFFVVTILLGFVVDLFVTAWRANAFERIVMRLGVA